MVSNMYGLISLMGVLVLLTRKLDCKSINGSSSVMNTTLGISPVTAQQLLVLRNETIVLDCAGPDATNDTNETNGTLTTTTSATTKQPTATTYSLHIFKKDELLYQLHSDQLSLRVDNDRDEGTYECGYYDLDKFGRLNYVVKKMWELKIHIPKQVVNTTTIATTEAPSTQHVYQEEAGFVENKKNINIFTYNNPVIIFLFIAGFLTISISFLVVLLLLNTRNSYNNRLKSKELLG
jgi:hypothetical protein